MFAAVLLCFVTDVCLEFTEVVVALGFRGRFVRVVGSVTFGSELFATVLRRPFLGFSPWCQRRTKIAPNAGAEMQHFWELAGAKMLHVVQHRFGVWVSGFV